MAIVTVDTATCYVERSWTGVETSFVAGFKAEATSDVKVYSRDAAGTETLLTEAVHYSVTLASDGAVTVVPIALPAAPKTILILRDTSPLQGTDFANLGAYAPSVHTQLHSRAAMRDAEDKFHRARAYLVPKGETADAIPAISVRKGFLFGWDATTGALKLYAATIGQILFGAGAPAGGLGNNGDVYLNNSNGDIYSKAAGAWTLQGNLKGPIGNPGARGVDAGLKYTWSTNTGATDPTAGVVKLNNATASAATAIYISETDADTNALAAEIATWDDSTNANKAHLKFYDPAAPSNFAEFFITAALTDNGAWDTLPVSYITGGGSFTNAQTIRIEAIIISNKGADGLGAGDVLGPATNTDSFIPQWNGANSKTLKNGVAIGASGGVQAWDADLDTLAGLGAWRTAYWNGSNAAVALSIGATDTVLASNGVAAAPSWRTAASVLGFTPVQQGTGIGQLTNTIKIGWSGSILKATVDTTDLGQVMFGGNNLGDLVAPATARTNLGVAYGKQTIWVPGDAMKSRTTTGATAAANTETATNKVQIHGPDFDPSTQQHVQFDVWMPKSYDAGTITAQFVWEHPSTTTNFGVVWGIQAFALGDNAAIDTAFGTAQEVTDTGGTTNNQYNSPETSALTIANTPAGEKLVRFQVYRKAADAADTLAVAARLLGVRILYNTNAANDT